MSDINKEVLDDDPDSLAVEADDNVYYLPDSESSVVAVEPQVVTNGRLKRRKYLKNEEMHNLSDKS